MNRRNALNNIMYLPLMAQFGAGEMPGHRIKKLKNFGLQLSTITPMMAGDFLGTLKMVSDIGYRQVEFSALGFLGRDVLEVKDLLAMNKLEAPVGRVAFNVSPDFMSMPRDQQIKVFGAQSGMESLQERIKNSLSECKALGQQYLIIPAIMPNVFSDLGQVKNMISILQESGKMCADAGVTLGYHNHNWEFPELEGSVPFEMMLNELDPKIFTFQLDTYWIRKAGRNLSDMLTKYAGRFVTCHLKDIDAEGDFEDVGHGQIDFPVFIREAIKQGAKHFFVERDTSDDPLESIKRSFGYIKEMHY